MINIVIPMAGYGSRFANAGFDVPKPLIPVHQVPMVRLVIENVTPDEPHRFIFICQGKHRDQYELETKLREWAPGCEIIFIKEVTAGAACTVLLAEEFIDDDCELMIVNSDQWVDVDINEYLSRQRKYFLDGLIMTMHASDPKWSYVGFNEAGKVSSVVEKKVALVHLCSSQPRRPRTSRPTGTLASSRWTTCEPPTTARQRRSPT